MPDVIAEEARVVAVEPDPIDYPMSGTEVPLERIEGFSGGSRKTGETPESLTRNT